MLELAWKPSKGPIKWKKRFARFKKIMHKKLTRPKAKIENNKQTRTQPKTLLGLVGLRPVLGSAKSHSRIVHSSRGGGLVKTVTNTADNTFIAII